MAGDGCQTHAGILKPNEGTLTPIAKKKFIQAVKDELMFGTDNLPGPVLFPCGDAVPPNPFAGLLDLEDETKFPEFHKNILGNYEKIAQALDLKSNFTLLPICCPVSLGFKLGANIHINFPKGFIPFFSPALPLLALKMKLMPPIKLATKFPSLLGIPPKPPNLSLPTFDPKLFVDLFNFNISFITGIPKLLLNIIAQIPQLALKIPSLPELFKLICKISFDSKLFGDISSDSLVEVVSTKVLTTKVVEMIMICAVGSTLGSSPGGLTGGIGKFLGYTPPPEPDADPDDPVRSKIINFSNTCDGLAFSKDKDDYAQKLFYKEYDDGSESKKNRAYNAASAASSCGLFVRACYFNGGAEESFFTDEYQDGTAINGLLAIAKKKDALIPFSNRDFPALKKGDALLIANASNASDAHVLLVHDDYGGGLGGPIVGVEGGQNDSRNSNRPTAIGTGTYDILSVVNGRVSAGQTNGISPKAIIGIFDGEKMVAPEDS